MNKNKENNILEREENIGALRGFNFSTLDIDNYVKWAGELGIFIRGLTNQDEINKVEAVIELLLTHAEIKIKEAKEYRKQYSRKN